MVSATLWASTALGVASSLKALRELVELYWTWRRAVPGEPAPPSAYDLGALETCPASCPAPSWAFCVREPLEEFALRCAAALPEVGLLAVAACCAAVGLAAGLLIGRWVWAPALRQPHGRRPGPAVRGGRR